MSVPPLLDEASALDLQARAGNTAVTGLTAVQRQDAGTTTLAPPESPSSEATRPVFREGDGPQSEIGELQQKLNAVAAALPRLRITAMYGPETTAAVTAFQTSHPPLVPDGTATQPTWAELDRLAPSVVRNGRVVVEGPAEGNPMATPEGSTHPTVRLGSNGPAVEELQQRLNNAAVAGTPLVVDGKFGPLTRGGVLRFQQGNPPLLPDGVVGPLTWAQVDLVPGPVSVGRVEFDSVERLEGNIYGGPSRYTWRLDGNRLVVTVNIQFTGASNHPKVAQWLGDISSIWNTMKIVNAESPGEEIDVEFVPARGSPPDASVRVVVDADPNNPGRSDTGNWHTGDNRRGLAPHEFGHLIGLDDEYNRPEEAYVETTGEQPDIGNAEGPASGTEPATIASEIRAAVTSEPPAGRGPATRAVVVTTHGLTQGAFSQRVAQAYEQANAGNLLGAGDIADDIAARIPDQGTADEVESVEPFLYSNRSLMGTMESVDSPVDEHDHPVEPRHIRQFVEIVRAQRPGRWRAERR